MVNDMIDFRRKYFNIDTLEFTNTAGDMVAFAGLKWAQCQSSNGKYVICGSAAFDDVTNAANNILTISIFRGTGTVPALDDVPSFKVEFELKGERINSTVDRGSVDVEFVIDLVRKNGDIVGCVRMVDDEHREQAQGNA